MLEQSMFGVLQTLWHKIRTEAEWFSGEKDKLRLLFFLEKTATTCVWIQTASACSCFSGTILLITGEKVGAGSCSNSNVQISKMCKIHIAEPAQKVLSARTSFHQYAYAVTFRNCVQLITPHHHHHHPATESSERREHSSQCGQKHLVWLTDAQRQIRRRLKYWKSHLWQASYVQVEADDEDVPGHPHSGPDCVLQGRDRDRLAPWREMIWHEWEVAATWICALLRKVKRARTHTHAHTHRAQPRGFLNSWIKVQHLSHSSVWGLWDLLTGWMTRHQWGGGVGRSKHTCWSPWTLSLSRLFPSTWDSGATFPSLLFSLQFLLLLFLNLIRLLYLRLILLHLPLFNLSASLHLSPLPSLFLPLTLPVWPLLLFTAWKEEEKSNSKHINTHL